MDYAKKSLELSEKHRGKLEVNPVISITNREELSTAYTPGVAEPCRQIHKNKADAYRYTIKARTVAVVSDGTAVLGLGDIGPEAAMPVMEGKCCLFKAFGGVDAFPICLDTKDTEEIIKTIKYLAPTFGGINLEDIAAPRCFEIEKRLQEELDIPVFHDDQHGTAIVVAAAMINALKVVKKKWEDIEIVINGAGAAGISIAQLLLRFKPKNIILVNSQGALVEGMEWMNPAQAEMVKVTNHNKEKGKLETVIKGKDVFIGVSVPGVLSAQMVSTMAEKAIVFAMANPIPEIMPEEAKKGGAAVIATGRSDYPNQVNNVLVFPGIFKGALQVQATAITEEMKLGAARAIAALIDESELGPENIIPDPFDMRVPDAVANEVASVAEKLGIARAPRK
ncbi:MAG: NAD(P)-dependent malic enzyme [Christensenellales bacterium]|nr:NAD-dependent malic enzyme [Clostridiales bacterium]